MTGGGRDHRGAYVASHGEPGASASHGPRVVERVWFRAVMAGELVEIPAGYDGGTAPESQSDEELLEQYANECRLATAAVSDLDLDTKPATWTCVVSWSMEDNASCSRNLPSEAPARCRGPCAVVLCCGAKSWRHPVLTRACPRHGVMTPRVAPRAAENHMEGA